MRGEIGVGLARNRFRLPPGQRHQEARLSLLFRGPVLDSALPAAIAAAGLRADAIVCLRRVSLQCVLRDAADAELAEAWSTALTQAVVRALRGGGDQVRVYRSRHVALSAMVGSALRDDLADAWAWVAAGIWPDADRTAPRVTRARVLDALTAAPEAAPEIVAAAAAAGLLDSLLASELLVLWRRLADAVARCRDVPVPGPSPAGKLEIPLPSSGPAAAIGALARRPGCDPAVARQLLRLAVMTAGPSRPASWLPRALAALVEPTGLTDRDIVSPARDTSTASSPSRTLAPPPLETTEAANRFRFEPSRLERAEALRSGRTEWGGLLFLIHIVREIDLPGRHRRGALGDALAGRSLRWVLYHLARRLVPADAGDPAALAFAGLGPDEVSPVEEDSSADSAALAALAAVAGEITASLRHRMERPEAEWEELVQVVCRRPARLVSDPGWIEVQLAMDEVHTDVRRAGLDLDPGWLPFLGVVLRFSYA